jgi:hypothetical protein
VKRYIAFVSLLAFAGLSLCAFAQQPPDLRRLARDAGTIFRGTVQKVEPAAAAGEIGRRENVAQFPGKTVFASATARINGLSCSPALIRPPACRG